MDARPWHVTALLARVEREERDRWNARGIDVKALLRRAVGSAFYCRVAILGNAVVAMWGVEGSLLDTCGRVWLVLTPAARALPLAVVRVARVEMQAIMTTKRELHSMVDATDGRAVRWLRFLGFTLSEPDDDGLRRAELRAA